MTTSLSKIIDMLPELTTGELTQLSALLSVRVAAASYPPGKATGSSKVKAGTSKPRAKKKEKGKSPPKVSEYRDIPEYKEFKASEKALHSYLKGQEGDERLLSHWVNKQAELLTLSKAERADLMADIPPVVAGFVEARNCWFRTKSDLSSKKPASDSKPPGGSDSDKKKENASEGTSDANPET